MKKEMFVFTRSSHPEQDKILENAAEFGKQNKDAGILDFVKKMERNTVNKKER